MQLYDTPPWKQRVNLVRPLLNQLSGSTTIIGAWSTCRSLKASTYSAGPMIVRSADAGTHTTIGFNGIILNKAALLAVCVGGSAEGAYQLNDQSGNANHMIANPGASDGILVSTTGTLTSPVTVAGGTSLPMLGFGPGNQSGGTGVNPNMRTAAPMPVSFGATAKHFILAVVKPTSGSGSNTGAIGAFTHTGDSNPFSSTTSIVECQCNASTTTGSYRATSNAVQLAHNTISVGAVGLIGGLCDGTNNTIYANRSAGTPVAFTSVLGAGGSYALGADPGAPTADNWAGFMAEIIVGTFTSTAATFAAGDWVTMQNNMRTFYGTP